MRSAAGGEHRTGEECLDGIAQGCAILPERWAIGARWNGAWWITVSKSEAKTVSRRVNQRLKG